MGTSKVNSSIAIDGDIKAVWSALTDEQKLTQ